MDGLNEVMPPTKEGKFTDSVPYFAGAKTRRQVVEAGLDRFIPVIRNHKEMVSQMFDIKMSVITSDRGTLKHKLALVNAIFRKTFGLTLKGEYVKKGGANVFTLELMDCFTYVDGVMALKLPSGKVVKSHLNAPKPPEEVPQVPAEVPQVAEEVQPINVRRLMDNIAHPDENTLLARQS